MTLLRALAVVACLACAPAAVAGAAEVSLTIRDGRVTLVARDATVRQILAEWGKVGKITIVNLERVPGGPVSIELRDVPESKALDTVLRSVAGFLAVRRTTPEPGTSEFHRIVVMPVLASAVPAAGGQRQGAMPSAPAVRPQSPFRPEGPFTNRRRPGEPAEEVDTTDETDPEVDEAEGSPVFPGGMRQPGMIQPGVNLPGMSPPVGDPGAPPASPDDPARMMFQPGRVPTGPTGAPLPGMMVPVPQQQGRPGQPATPQPPKSPGDPR